MSDTDFLFMLHSWLIVLCIASIVISRRCQSAMLLTGIFILSFHASLIEQLLQSILAGQK